jgi:regulatory protein
MAATSKTTYEKNLKKVKEICSKQEKSISEIRKKLQAMDVCEDDQDRMIHTLTGENFLNEYRYASSFAADKSRLNRWGKQKIAYALKQKRIAEDTVQQVLNAFDEEEYQKMIMGELKKKKETIHSSCKNTVREKIFRFAQSRGYELEYIYIYLSTI